MSIVMGAIRSPRSQARTRSSCQAIFVPSRISFSTCSVIPLISLLSPSKAAQLAQVFFLFAKHFQPRIAFFPHQSFQAKRQFALGRYAQTFPKLHGHGVGLIALDNMHISLLDAKNGFAHPDGGGYALNAFRRRKGCPCGLYTGIVEIHCLAITRRGLVIIEKAVYQKRRQANGWNVVMRQTKQGTREAMAAR